MKKRLHYLLTLVVITLMSNLTTAQVSTFPYAEDFETFSTCTGSCGATCLMLNGWSNETTLDGSGQWITDNFGTSSSTTGPTANGGADYNPGISGGKYLYFESSSPCYPNVSAWLYSPTIDLTGVSGMNMAFAYHMYGATQGSLNIDVSSDGGSTWTTGIWTQSGDLGDVWNTDTLSLAAYVGQMIIVRFRGTTTSSFTADMAIDDVLFYEPLPNDAGITAITEPGLPSCNLVNSNVTGKVFNYGYDTLTSVIIDWAVNGVAQTPYNWTGSVAPGGSVDQLLGTYTFVDGDTLTVSTSMPNAMAEMGSGPMNDTMQIIISSGLAGTYTIDPSGAGDYLSFTDAVAAVTSFGLCDDVTFNVVDGIYNEQITLTEVGNANDTNTITFQSLMADPTNCILAYAGTSSLNNQVIMLDGGDHFIFRNLTIFNPGATYGTVIRVDNGSHMNRFEGNIIAGDSVITTTSTNRALVYSPSGSIDTMNVFDGNDMMYGSYAFYWYGSGTTSLEYGTKIINNHFENTYYRPIHSYYQEDVEIGGNTMIANPNYTGSVYRIYMYYNMGPSRVYGNRMEGNNYGYGMYMSQCDGYALDRGYIYNNFMHIGDSTTTSTSYGIYMTGCDYQVVTHNSINMTSNGTFTRGMYVTGSGNIVVRNNAIMNDGPGYGIYHLSGITECDYNNVYVPNGNLYYQSGDINDLAVWQSMTGFGMMSDTLDPMFMSADNLHTCANQLDGAAIVDTMVMYDIDGELRDTNTPDIGADEFLVPGNLSFAEDTLWKCSGDVITLGGWEPSAGASYQWSTLETTPTIDALNEGTYFVNISGACGNGSPSVVVQNIPDAVANFALIQSFMTAQGTNTSTGTYNTYLWDMGDGTTYTTENVTHVYADTGWYTVSLTVTGPCGSDTYTTQMFSTTVGLDEVAIDNALTVYPNPNTGEFTINLDLDQAAEVTAVMTDLQGKVIWSEQLGTVSGNVVQEVNLSENATGIYLLEVTVNDASVVRRIVVE